MPEDWQPNIVQGKAYDTNTILGRTLYNQVMSILNDRNIHQSEIIAESSDVDRYSSGKIVYPRIGLGTFKVMVTETYHRICALTGEKTLPALEAAHIKPFSQNSPNMTNNMETNGNIMLYMEKG